jgi:hypothetical protein
MSDGKKLITFPIQVKGGRIYQVTIRYIAAEVADRYGWKPDRLIAWTEFEPSVGSTIGTYVEIPLREYSREELVLTLTHRVEETIINSLNEQENNRLVMEVQEAHKLKLAACAERVSAMLERGKAGS